jgi:hypothetical protein
MSSTSRQFNQVQVTRVYSPELTHSRLLVSRAISTTNFLLPDIKLLLPPLTAHHTTLINRLLHRDLHQCASYTPIESHKGGACCDRLVAKRRRLLFLFFTAFGDSANNITWIDSVQVPIHQSGCGGMFHLERKCAFYIVGAILISKYRK